MTSENSLKAYYELKEDGTLSKRRLEVFEAILNNPDKTNGELCVILGGVDSNYVNPRRREIQLMGLIESNGSRECGYTGKIANIWKVAEIDKEKARNTNFKKKKEKKLDLDIDALLSKCKIKEIPFPNVINGEYWQKGKYVLVSELKKVLDFGN